MSDEDAAAGGSAAGEQQQQPDPPVMASGRARRSAAKRVDYAKEQEFSDAEDIFEDSDKEEAAAPVYRAAPAARKPRSAGRQPRRPRATPASSGGGGAAASQSAGYGGSTPAAYEYSEAPGVDLSDLASSRPVYTEKGYDPSLPPIRERFPFLPEYEEDGSPKIELIVGRRMVDEKEVNNDSKDDVVDDDVDDDDDDEDEENGSPVRRRRSVKTKAKTKKKTAAAATPPTTNTSSDVGPAEYEYLVKYKGRSYLHLEWKSGADLESMNKSAKGIYRRYLKKVAAGDSEDLENPEFDPSYAIPEKILDHADQEITVELSDKELLRLEKEREKELAKVKQNEMEEEDDDEDESNHKTSATPGKGQTQGSSSNEGPAAGVNEGSFSRRPASNTLFCCDRPRLTYQFCFFVTSSSPRPQLRPSRTTSTTGRGWMRSTTPSYRWTGCGRLRTASRTTRRSRGRTTRTGTGSSRSPRRSRGRATCSFRAACGRSTGSGTRARRRPKS
jgi:hypothetical protein